MRRVSLKVERNLVCKKSVVVIITSVVSGIQKLEKKIRASRGVVEVEIALGYCEVVGFGEGGVLID